MILGRKMASKRGSEIDEKMHDFLSCLGDVIFRILGDFRLPKSDQKVDQNQWKNQVTHPGPKDDFFGQPGGMRKSSGETPRMGDIRPAKI